MTYMTPKEISNAKKQMETHIGLNILQEICNDHANNEFLTTKERLMGAFASSEIEQIKYLLDEDIITSEEISEMITNPEIAGQILNNI